MPWKKIIAAAGITASLSIPLATVAVSAAPGIAVTASASAQHPKTHYYD